MALKQHSVQASVSISVHIDLTMNVSNHVETSASQIIQSYAAFQVIQKGGKSPICPDGKSTASIKRCSFVTQGLNGGVNCADLISSPTILLLDHFHWGRAELARGEGGWSSKANTKHNYFFLSAEDKMPAVDHLAAKLLTMSFLSEMPQFLQIQTSLQTD